MSLSSVNRSPARSNSTAFPQLHGRDGRVLRLVAREDVDVVVVQSSGRDHESMRVESCRSDRGRAVPQEARVGLEGRDELAVVDIEDLHAVLLSSTAILLANVLFGLMQ
jgi:hypothetical protein